MAIFKQLTMHSLSSTLFNCFLVGFIAQQAFGCHDPRHARRKRQSGTSAASQEVEFTQELRDFFVACMRDGIGDKYNWETVVDYTVLDTTWYENSGSSVCGVGQNDTVECWQARLYNYIRNDEEEIERAKVCIDLYSSAVQQSTNGVVYQSRSKRGIRSVSQPAVLIEQYAKCVESKVVNFPSNRRRLNFPSLIQFVNDLAICGDCNISSASLLSGSEVLSRSKRTVADDYGIERVTILLESIANTYVPFTPSLVDNNGCSPTAVFPYRFDALTKSTSPLSTPITSCNIAFNDVFLPDPCSGLTNARGDSFCHAQQSWCMGWYADFMRVNCERTCCSMGIDTLRDPPPVGWDDWTPWGACPAPCEQTAMQTRKRDCPLGVAGVEPCLGSAIESRTCQSLLTCPGWTVWGPWSACSATCGSSVVASASRNCQHPSGSCAGPRTRTRSCVVPQCQGIFSAWSTWTSCSVTCGGGIRSRSRQCVGYPSCVSDRWLQAIDQNQACAQQACPGRWTDWAPWSQCAVTCGSVTASQFRSRTCVGGPPGGPGCLGRSQEVQACGRTTCPPPQWADWSTWSECTWKRRTRACVGGPPGSGTCVGRVEEYLECDGACAPPGGQDETPGTTTTAATSVSWSQWGSWSLCSAACGFGTRTRTRVCYPGPGYCTGSSIARERCFRSRCF